MVIDRLKQMALNEGLDIKTINAIKTLAHAIGFTNTIFVSSAGNNGDGSSWEEAYTSLNTALDYVENNQISGENYLIYVGVGTFDLNTATPDYSKDFDIIGSGRSQTKIINTHAGATEVIHLTGLVRMFSLKIDTGVSAIDGVVVSGSGTIGFEAYDVYFEGDSATGAMSCLKLDGGTEYVRLYDCQFHGAVGSSTGLHLNECEQSHFDSLFFCDCLIAIHLDHAGDDDNHFDDIKICESTTGIQIDNAGSNNNVFEDIQFVATTTKIDDSGSNTAFHDVRVMGRMVATVYPADLTGQAIAAAAGANNWTAVAVEIRSAATATEPFYVTGLVFEGDTLEKWGVRLYDDGGTSPFWEGILEAAANRSQRVVFAASYLISQGTAIHGTVKSETGGNTMDIWLKIEAI